MPTTPIEINDPLLDNLQANILKGHGRKFAHHLFFELDKSKADSARTWISQFATTGITSAKKQLQDTTDFKLGKTTDGGTIFTLSLSSSGYDKLALAESRPASIPFRNGMQASADLLGDKIAYWEKPFKSSVDMLIIVADDNGLTAKTNANNIIQQVSGFAGILLNQRGNVLKTKSGIGIEHFGYADGISQPLYLSTDINNQQSTTEWNDSTDANLLLVKDKATSAANCFGSFLVFRKLEQNVKAFNLAEDQLVPVKDVDGKINKDLAGAMLVGRFENSLPAVKSSTGIQTNPPNITNDFNYTDDLSATKCPFHAHIRLMNPRNGDTIAGDVSEQRITRRGIPYDDVQRIPEDRITTISDDLLEQNQPDKGVGLLFMCYQSNIDSQFEVLQGFWANKGQIKGHLIGAEDSIIGQGANPDKTLPLQWQQPAQSKPFDFHGFVTMKGGEYFFTPSICFLQNLGNSQMMV